MQIKINKFNLQIGLIIGVLQHSNYQKESNFKEPLKIDDFFSGLFQAGELNAVKSTIYCLRNLRLRIFNGPCGTCVKSILRLMYSEFKVLQELKKHHANHFLIFVCNISFGNVSYL